MAFPIDMDDRKGWIWLSPRNSRGPSMGILHRSLELVAGDCDGSTASRLCPGALHGGVAT